MDALTIYALVLITIFVSLLLLQIRTSATRIFHVSSLLVHKHLVYPQLLRRHRFIGPWSRFCALLQLLYLTVNVFCCYFGTSSAYLAGVRAGYLALVNFAILYAGPHLSFLSDLLGLPLSVYHLLHYSAAVVSCLLVAIHVITVTTDASFAFGDFDSLSALIATSTLGLLFLFSHVFFRRHLYEVFLRTHQVLAGFLGYFLWQHLQAQPPFIWLYVYTCAAIFGSALLLECSLILYRNKSFGRRLSRVSITQDHGIVKIRLNLSRTLKVDAGQYINLWIPGISFWSIAQSHPFVVMSWSDTEQSHLELFVEPRRGLTQNLLRISRENSSAASHLALFSGPHGKSVPVAAYETVLMVASGFGIVTQLPYLKRLIHGYNACKTFTRRVHLVWQIETIDLGLAMESVLNDSLEDDTLDDGYILSISVYVRCGDADRVHFGRRAIVYKGDANLATILQEEAAGKYIRRMRSEAGESGPMLVLVSASDTLRDQLRGLVRGYLYDKVKMEVLDYQPS